MKTTFRKYHALGNDMIVIDPAKFDLALEPALVRRLCQRRYGVGADGICYGPLQADSSVFGMRFFNPDGSEAQKSGNGLRIFARYLWDAGYVTHRAFRIKIQSEIVSARILNRDASRFAIGMGRISFESRDVPVTGPNREVFGEPLQLDQLKVHITAVSIGNPHCVIFATDLTQINDIGSQLETAEIFPERTNVQLVEVLGEHQIQITIWERGAGHTLASGSSASAAACVAVRHGYCKSPVTVTMEGGSAVVHIDKTWAVTLEGDVSVVFEGTLAADML